MPVKIYIGNVNKDASREELETLFKQYGEITECSILTNFAFVHMADETQAQTAINELNNCMFAGQAISVQLSKGKTHNGFSKRPVRGIPERLPRFTKKDGSTKIFVGNISEDTENSDLRSLFEVYGTVEEADICGGYGFVHMPIQKEALKAISELRGHTLNGKTINVELSTVNTQGRSRFADDHGFEEDLMGNWNGSYGGPVRESMSEGLRYNPYKLQAPPRKMSLRGPRGRGGMFGSRFPPSLIPPPLPRMPRNPPASERDSFIKELLELYLRDPEAFDRYARDPAVHQSLNINFFEEEEPLAPQRNTQETFYGPSNNYYETQQLNNPLAETAPVMYPNLPPPSMPNSGQSLRPPPLSNFPPLRLPGPSSASEYTSFE